MADDKPHVYVPPGTAPPAELEIEELVVGEGPEARSGQEVEVHYVGVAWSTRQQFDASWDRGDTFRFGLGAGQVIKGWDQGVKGMKEGEKRQLVVPPTLGYGAEGTPDGTIPPNATLVFEVELLGLK